MKQRVDVAIIGAGTAGLSALHEVRKRTQNFVLINDGPYGTTCARVGCMPSKALIQVANDYFRRHTFDELGIRGQAALHLDSRAALQRVRTLRDQFIEGPIKTATDLAERCISGKAEFIEPNVLKIGKRQIAAKAVVIATGSRPLVPLSWRSLGSKILTSDTVFELKELPKSMAVVGVGAIGLEMAQALSRLGVAVHSFGRSGKIGGVTDPEISQAIVDILGEEFRIHQHVTVQLNPEKDQVRVSGKAVSHQVDAVLACLGRVPNLDTLGLEKVGIPLQKNGVPQFDPLTMKVKKQPIFIAGDVTADKTVLHEAANEGRIAGYNSVRTRPKRFARQTPLAIIFTDPQIAVVGDRFSDIRKGRIAIGEVDFRTQGRARIMAKNKGKLRVYVDKKSKVILGSEMIAPSAEHLAHYLAALIQMRVPISKALALPYYHPVISEGLRTALKMAFREL